MPTVTRMQRLSGATPAMRMKTRSFSSKADSTALARSVEPQSMATKLVADGKAARPSSPAMRP